MAGFQTEVVDDPSSSGFGKAQIGLAPRRSVSLSVASSNSPLSRRESFDTYPPFLETIPCLVLISGESGDSSPGPGLDEKGKIAVISANPERFSGEILR